MTSIGEVEAWLSPRLPAQASSSCFVGMPRQGCEPFVGRALPVGQDRPRHRRCSSGGGAAQWGALLLGQVLHGAGHVVLENEVGEQQLLAAEAGVEREASLLEAALARYGRHGTGRVGQPIEQVAVLSREDPCISASCSSRRSGTPGGGIPCAADAGNPSVRQVLLEQSSGQVKDELAALDPALSADAVDPAAAMPAIQPPDR